MMDNNRFLAEETKIKWGRCGDIVAITFVTQFLRLGDSGTGNDNFLSENGDFYAAFECMGLSLQIF